MTVLTKITLDTRKRAVREVIRDCQQTHQQVMRCVSDGRHVAAERPRLETSTLYRLQTDLQGTSSVLIQTDGPIEPSLFAGGSFAGDVDVTGLLSRIAEGSQVRYTATVAPTKSVRPPMLNDGESRYGMRGHKVPIKAPGDMLDWWLGRESTFGLKHGTDEYGFPQALVDPLGTLFGNRGGKRIRFTPWKVNGIASVTDPIAFGRAVRTGIGPGKAYGQGLLTFVLIGR